MSLTSPARQEAARAVNALRDALAKHGIVLPSLDIDDFSLSGVTALPPLVELGRCNLDTAHKLAEALEAVHG